MGGLVQQPAVDGADWQHLSRRSRTTLLRPTGVPTVGRVTQTKSPPGIPARFTLPLCACITVIELLRHGHGAEAWTMAVLLAASMILSKRVTGHLRCETGTQIRPEQIARAM